MVNLELFPDYVYSENPVILYNTPLSYKNIAFTGSLYSMKRTEAVKAVRKAGSIYSSGLTKKTDILVAGHFRKGRASRKMNKYAEYKGKGIDIQVLNEDEFISYVVRYGLG